MNQLVLVCAYKYWIFISFREFKAGFVSAITIAGLPSASLKFRWPLKFSVCNITPSAFMLIIKLGALGSIGTF